MNTRPSLTVHIDSHVYTYTGRYWCIDILGTPIRVHDKQLTAALSAVAVEFRGRDAVSAKDWKSLQKAMKMRRGTR